MTHPPNQPHAYLVTKPGGMTGVEHALHIIICLFTCGLWIPGYIIFAAKAPVQRVEVVVPYGADPAQVAEVRAQAAVAARTVPAQSSQPTDKKTAIVGGIIMVTLAVIFVAFFVWYMSLPRGY